MQPTRLMSHDSNIRILSWNARFTDKIGWFDEGEFDRCGQMERRCIYSTNYLVYNQSDVILLDSFYLRFDEFPKYRLPGQKWVFNGYESPDRKSWPNYGVYDSWYNLTMTFTEDSDIFNPYGICVDTMVSASRQNRHVKAMFGEYEQPYLEMAKLFIQKSNRDMRNSKTGFQRKTGGAVWIVSNCETNSLREHYAASLAKHIPVDVFGQCGKGKVSKEKESKMLNEQYRFYLAFENTLCEEYTTEKLYKALSLAIIPVVLGNVNYSSILPPHSYIDVRNFKSTFHLANYLNYLTRNDTAYQEYFTWKKRYVCFNKITTPSLACRLCSYLNNNYSEKSSIKSISQFWSRNKRCISSNQFYSGIIKN